MELFDITYWTVAVAALAGWLLGALWYSPLLFGEQWQRFVTEDKPNIDIQGGQAPYYMAISFVAQLVMAFVLVHVIGAFEATGLWDGIQAGFWCWLGFVGTTGLINGIFQQQPIPLYLIDTGYHLATLMVMGGLLAVL